MVLEIFLMWNCIEAKDCAEVGDLSNIAATYIGIVIGTLLGLIISWVIYNRQKKTSDKQDKTLSSIKKLEERHKHILETVEKFEQNHDKILKNILIIEKKIDSLLENK